MPALHDPVSMRVCWPAEMGDTIFTIASRSATHELYQPWRGPQHGATALGRAAVALGLTLGLALEHSAWAQATVAGCVQSTTRYSREVGRTPPGEPPTHDSCG
jgi:urease accessory protein UreF